MVLVCSPLKSPGGDIIKDMIRQPYYRIGTVLLVTNFTLVLEVCPSFEETNGEYRGTAASFWFKIHHIRFTARQQVRQLEIG